MSGSCKADLTERAVYLHRLVTARKYAGHGLGESLINWAEKYARAKYRAKWIRIDVWTTNTDLHRYLSRSSVSRPAGNALIPRYPSGSALPEARRLPEGVRLWLSSLHATSSRPPRIGP